MSHAYVKSGRCACARTDKWRAGRLLVGCAVHWNRARWHDMQPGLERPLSKRSSAMCISGPACVQSRSAVRIANQPIIIFTFSPIAPRAVGVLVAAPCAFYIIYDAICISAYKISYQADWWYLLAISF